MTIRYEDNSFKMGLSRNYKGPYTTVSAPKTLSQFATPKEIENTLYYSMVYGRGIMRVWDTTILCRDQSSGNLWEYHYFCWLKTTEAKVPVNGEPLCTVTPLENQGHFKVTAYDIHKGRFYAALFKLASYPG